LAIHCTKFPVATGYLSQIETEIWYQNPLYGVAGLGFKRYKYVVQVVLGEQHGAGIKIGSRCLWDADTDNYASDVFWNVSNYWS
jgi:hypothetical protein